MAKGIKPDPPQKVKDLKTGTLTVRPLKNVKYTGKLMRELSVRYQTDVAMYGHLSFIEFYNLIKNIPYKEDPKKQEFLQRPYYTLTGRGKGGDCDDKCICIGAYCAMAEIPFRFVACGALDNGRLHHVIVEVLIDNQWVHVDPTYAFNTIGKQLHNYKRRMVISQEYPVLNRQYPSTFNHRSSL